MKHKLGPYLSRHYTKNFLNHDPYKCNLFFPKPSRSFKNLKYFRRIISSSSFNLEISKTKFHFVNEKVELRTLCYVSITLYIFLIPYILELTKAKKKFNIYDHCCK